jgi:hypothetical protein
MKKILALAASMLIAAVSHAGVIFADDFESYSTTNGIGLLSEGGWNVGGTDAIGRVFDNGVNGVGAVRNETFVTRLMNWDPTGSDVLTFSTDLYIAPELHQGTFGFTLMNEEGGNIANAEFNLQDKTLFGTRPADIEKFNLRITLDSSNQTTSYYIDNTLVASNVYSGPGDYSLRSFFVGSYEGVNDDGYMTFDNLSVSTNAQPVPEPATLAVLGLGALMLRRKKKSA